MTTTDPNNEDLSKTLSEALAPAALTDMSDADIERLLNDVATEPLSAAAIARILKQANPAHQSDRTVRLPAGSKPNRTQPGSSKEITMSMSNPRRHGGDHGMHRGSVGALLVASLSLMLVVILTVRPKTTTQLAKAPPVSFGQAVKDVWTKQPLVQDVATAVDKYTPVNVGQILETAPRQQRRLSLPDGSVLFMNENTTAKLESLRQLNVTQGEVFIEVCPDFDEEENRLPFFVTTPKKEVRAVGTKFAVTASDETTDVLVTQGKVLIDGLNETITAGRFVRFKGNNEARLEMAPRASEALSWTEDLMAAAPIVPPSQYCGGALVSVDPHGQEMNLSLRKYHVDVHIQDGFARTTIDQSYFNHTWSRLKGMFKFPLPPDASLSRLAMYVGPKLMEGGMAERGHARATFEQIVHTKRDPALLEWVDGSTFQMEVFPLEPRQEKRLLISYTQRLNTAYGKTHYRFPAGHNMDVVRDWSTTVRVKNGERLAFKSSSHLLQAERAQGDLVLNTSMKNALFDRDFVVEIEDDWNQEKAVEASESQTVASADHAIAPASGSAKNRAVALGSYRLTRATHEDHQYLMLRHRPELTAKPEQKNRNWVFLYETSGDRNPVLARTQIEVIRTLLNNAEHEDTFNIVAAGTRAKQFRDAAVLCDEKNIADAVKWMEGAHIVGALELQNALRASVRLCTPVVLAANDQQPAWRARGLEAKPGLAELQEAEAAPAKPVAEDKPSVASAKGEPAVASLQVPAAMPAQLADKAKSGRKAKRRSYSSQPLGETDMFDVTAGRRRHDRETFLVHVGSGLAVLGETSEKALVADLPGSIRYVGVGVGKKWSRQFMRMAASRTGGYFTQINPDEKVQWRAFELHSVLNAPRLTNVGVVDDAEKLSFLTYADCIAHGDEVCAITRLAKDAELPKNLIISGQLDGETWQQSVAVANVTDKADYLPRSWAKLEIDRLVADGAASHRDDIIQLSKAMYVMSPFTSLLVLETEADYVRYKVDRGRKDHWALYPAPDTIKVVTDYPQRGRVARAQPEVGAGTVLRRYEAPLFAPPTAVSTSAGGELLLGGVPVTPVYDGLMNQRRYAEAEVIGKRLAELAPESTEALVMHEKAKFARREFLTRRAMREREEGAWGVLQDVERELSEFDPWITQKQAWGRDYDLGGRGEISVNRISDPNELLGLRFDEEARARHYSALTGRPPLLESLVEEQGRARSVQVLSGLEARIADQLQTIRRLQEERDGPMNLQGDVILQPLEEFGAIVAKGNQPDAETVEPIVEQRKATQQVPFFGSRQRMVPARGGQTREGAKVRRMESAAPGSVTRKYMAQSKSEAETYRRRLQRLKKSRVAVEKTASEQVDRKNPELVALQSQLRSLQATFETRPSVSFGQPHLGVAAGAGPGNVDLYGQPAMPMTRGTSMRFNRRTPVAGGGGGGFGGGGGRGFGEQMDRPAISRFALTPAEDIPSYVLDLSDQSSYFTKRTWADQNNNLFYYTPMATDLSRGEEQSTQLRMINGDIADHWYGYAPQPDFFDAGLRPEPNGEFQRVLWDQVSKLERDYLVAGEREGWDHLQTLSLGRRLNLMADVLRRQGAIHPTIKLLPVAEILKGRFLSDLMAHAPGLNSSRADALAAMEKHSGRKSATGRIDAAAQKLIEKARGLGWETVRLGAGADTIAVHCNGQGQFAWERSVSEGLREQVLCDGQYVWHLYDEIGLGAKRTYSRFHRGMIASAAPWLVAPAEELAIGANVVLVDERTVGIVPLARNSSVDPQGASVPRSVRVELSFAKNGRLKERRIVRVQDGKTETLARTVFARRGAITVFGSDGKQVAKLARSRTSGAAFGGLVTRSVKATLEARRDQLAILPLPYRSASHVFAQVGPKAEQRHKQDRDYSQWSEENALALVAADIIGGNRQRVTDVVMSRFFRQNDTRAGLYVLVGNTNPLRRDNQKPIINYQPNSRTPEGHKALVRFVRHLALKPIKDQFADDTLTTDGLDVDGDNFGFVRNIATARNTYYRWVDGTAVNQRLRGTVQDEVNKAIGVVGSLKSPAIGWTILRAMQPHLKKAHFQSQFAEAAKKYEDTPHIGWFVRHERARALFAAKQDEEAALLYGKLLTSTLKAGFNPGIDVDLRKRFIEHRGQRNWSDMCRRTGMTLIDDGMLATAITLSKQLRELGDVDTASTIFDKVVARLEPKDRPDVGLQLVRHYRNQKDDAAADAMFEQTLQNPILATSAKLWRYGSELAEARGRNAEALARLERAINIEFVTRPDVINLQKTRAKYGRLLARYEKIADASATLEQQPPSDLVARIVRAADQWRSMEDNDTQVCQLTARVLKKLNHNDRAWDYLTTPLATQPGSASWRSLGQNLNQQGEIAEASVAYTRAFEFEQTNPEILYEHAVLLRNDGQVEAANTLLMKIVHGKWQPRFAAVKHNATSLLRQLGTDPLEQ